MKKESRLQEIEPWINSNYERVQYERWAANNLQVALDAERKYWHPKPCLMVRVMRIVLLAAAVLGGTMLLDLLLNMWQWREWL